VSLGDLDGDGDLDMAVANFAGDTSVLLNNGDGTFAAQTRFAAGTNPASVSLGDLDGDGEIDMAVASSGSNSVRVLLNQSQTVDPPDPTDFNGDGVTDFFDLLAFLEALEGA
jgi:hypothetical protein